MNKLHIKRRATACLLLGLTLSACATPRAYVREPLNPARAAGSHLGVVRMTSGWVNTNESFADTFTDALHETLGRCARGPARLDLRVHVDRVRREDRWIAATQGGRHELAAVAEFVDPVTRQVVGRYPIHVDVDAGSPLEALLADRQLMVSQAYAEALCSEAFPR